MKTAHSPRHNAGFNIYMVFALVVCFAFFTLAIKQRIDRENRRQLQIIIDKMDRIVDRTQRSSL